MISRTRAIVLHHIKYGDTSIIVHTYTEAYGRISFMVQGIRKKNSRIKVNIFQPLYILDLEVYYKQKRQLQKIKEARNACPYQTIPYDYRKRSMALFLAELLYRCLQEEEGHPDLYHFIENNLRIFDLKEKGLSNFHLYFMIHLTKYLGFFPQDNFDESNIYFNSLKGYFTPFKPNHHHFLDQPESYLFHRLLQWSDNQHEDLKLERPGRMRLLHGLLDFYYLHNQAMGHINSYEILKETFR
jgi:DNA repair protein RecO (recombination protein O)